LSQEPKQAHRLLPHSGNAKRLLGTHQMKEQRPPWTPGWPLTMTE